MKKKLMYIIIGILMHTTILAEAKYVFLFIGDGMGLSHINATEIYLKSIKEEEKDLSFTNFPAQGFSKTYTVDSFITDSAAGGTSIATGYKTKSGIISMDESKSKKYRTITEIAKQEKKFKIGIVTDVQLDHATPAVFYAHQPSRNNYYEIALELARSNVDYFGGGGIKGDVGIEFTDERSIKRKIVENGFKYVNSREEFKKLKSGSEKVIAINPELNGTVMNYEIDRQSNELALKDFTSKGIELLKDNEEGFMMMIEGGKIDWASHANDGATVLKEILAFNDAIKEAIQFYNKHPKETLIVVTADHETGGLSTGTYETESNSYYKKLKHQKVSYSKFNEISHFEKLNPKITLEDLRPLIKKNFGLYLLKEKERRELKRKARKGDQNAKMKLEMMLSPNEERDLKLALKRSVNYNGNNKFDPILYGSYDPFTITLTRILNDKSGIGWTTYSHTSDPVPVFAKGYGSENFNGYFENTEIFRKISDAIGLKK